MTASLRVRIPSSGTTGVFLTDKDAKQFVKSVNGITPDGHGNVDLQAQAYDLKDGYSYTENVYISEDGTETPLAGKNYKCFDCIPVKAGVSYTMYGCGFALYDTQANFMEAVHDATGANQMYEFTPQESGFVRLTINCEDVAYARFCRTDEKHLEPCDYEAAPSPFFDPRVPCDVHAYGDSITEGYGLDDPAKAWSNRLGALITSMKKSLYNRRFAAFADKAAGSVNYILNDTGYIRFTAYTNLFGVTIENVGEIAVYIDGQQQDPIVQSGNKAFNFEEFGSHTIELYGVSGINSISVIATRKQRTFENHAVFGSIASAGLPAVPDGNVSIVMYGTNDRMIYPGFFYKTINDFIRSCKAAGGIVYIFTPVPPSAAGEVDPSYKQSINDVIAQLPPDCINVYKELQLVEMLGSETIYSDNLHLNEFGHKVLYVVAAAKLQLAPAMSEVL
jgi:lysophospholipase L1-like esterase